MIFPYLPSTQIPGSLTMFGSPVPAGSGPRSNRRGNRRADAAFHSFRRHQSSRADAGRFGPIRLCREPRLKQRYDFPRRFNDWSADSSWPTRECGNGADVGGTR